MHTENSRQVLRVCIPLTFMTIALLALATFPDSSRGSKAQPEAAEFDVAASELSAETVLRGTSRDYIPKANQFSSPSLSILPINYVKYAGDLQFDADGSMAPNSLGKFTVDEKRERKGLGNSVALVSYRDKATSEPNDFFGIENSEPGFIFLLGDETGAVSVYAATVLKKYQEISPRPGILGEGSEKHLFLVATTGGLNPSTGLWSGTNIIVVVAQQLS